MKDFYILKNLLFNKVFYCHINKVSLEEDTWKDWVFGPDQVLIERGYVMSLINKLLKVLSWLYDNDQLFCGREESGACSTVFSTEYKISECENNLFVYYETISKMTNVELESLRNDLNELSHASKKDMRRIYKKNSYASSSVLPEPSVLAMLYLTLSTPVYFNINRVSDEKMHLELILKINRNHSIRSDDE